MGEVAPSASIPASQDAPARRGASSSAALAGLEAHPHARAVLGPGVPPKGSPSHAYLFHGPPGTGRRAVARAFASNGASAREVMQLVMVTQYFDTLKSIGESDRTNTLFLAHSPGAVKDVSDQIMESMLIATKANS